MNITITPKQILVDGKAVGKVTDFKLLRDALLTNLGKSSAVYLAVALMGEARTSDIAQFLDMDRSNVGKSLQLLEEDGLLEIVDDAHHVGTRGRPSRLWAVAKK